MTPIRHFGRAPSSHLAQESYRPFVLYGVFAPDAWVDVAHFVHFSLFDCIILLWTAFASEDVSCNTIHSFPFARAFLILESTGAFLVAAVFLFAFIIFLFPSSTA